MPHIDWTDEAFDDLERRYQHLEPHSVNSAIRAIGSIEAAVEQLRIYPQLGRAITNRRESRQLTVRFGKGAYLVHYLVHYRFAHDELLILAIRYSRDETPENL